MTSEEIKANKALMYGQLVQDSPELVAKAKEVEDQVLEFLKTTITSAEKSEQQAVAIGVTCATFGLIDFIESL